MGSGSLFDVSCSFCDRPRLKAGRLIAGPNVYICEGCVDVARRAVGTEVTREQCSFCGHRQRTAVICGECVALCRDMLG